MSYGFKLIVDILKQPAILVALVAVIGLILQKKNIADITKGGSKTFIGFLVLSGGAGLVVSSLEPFSDMFKQAFHVSGVVPNNEAIVAIALEKFGVLTAFVMFLGMIFNIILARITCFKYIYLSGHCIIYFACMIAVILNASGFSDVLTVVFGGLFLSLFLILSPAIQQPFMKAITGNDNVAMAHTGGVGYCLSAIIGKYVGDKEKTTENIKFPTGLGFLRDSTVSIFITMMIFYVIVAIFAGNQYIEANLSGGENFIIYAIKMAGQFSGGVFVILAGVRLILNEIIPAFKGISEKLVPNAKPALDCPIVFTFAPNAVLIGFFSSFVGGLFSMVIMVLLNTTIILPGVVPHFFCGATAGVFGNSTGGVKGCVVGSFVHGGLISFLPILLMPILGNLGFVGSTFSDADYGVAGILLGLLAKYKEIGVGGFLAVVILALIITSKNRVKGE